MQTVFVEVFRWSPDFFRLLLSNCLTWKINCDDHSLLSSTPAAHLWIISYILHVTVFHVALFLDICGKKRFVLTLSLKLTMFCFLLRKPYLHMDFQVFLDPTECRECLASRGRKDRREEMELKDRLVIRGRRECWDKRERKEMKGLVGRADHQEWWV